MADSTSPLTPLLVFVFAGVIFIYAVAKSAESKFRHIPAIGPTGPLASYWGVLRYMFRCREVTIEGYKKYPDGIFRVPLLQEWLVFCSGQKLLEEVRKASESELSMDVAMDDMLQTQYTLDQSIHNDHYHIDVIRHSTLRNLVACFPDIRDEIQQAFEDNLSLSGNEWKSFHAMTLILSVVGRTTNRLLVGLPLCRDPEYLEINTKFTIDVLTIANFLRLLPRFLRPIVGKLVSKLESYKKRTHKLVVGMINERLKMEEQYGKDWPDKPNDMLSWLIDKAPPHLCTVDNFIIRILAINFAAIHTTSLNFAHALYHLAAEPEHAVILREEVDAIIEEDGWTKAAIDRMIKIDSFLRESQRINGLASANMSRVVVKDFTFSNGIVVPAGTTIVVPIYPIHHDEAVWPDPYRFDPYRSSRMREKDANDVKQQLVTPSPEFLSWGYGKHACPGRFLANSELKAMLAHVVHAYDVKFQVEGVRPPNLWITGVCLPNKDAKVMFRKRTKQ